MNLSLSSKFEKDEQFIQFKQKIKSSNEIAKNLKDKLKLLDDILIKIKDYKSQNPLDYLKTVGLLAKYSVSPKTKVLKN